MPVNLFELKKWGDISYAVPLRLKSGETRPPRPHRSKPMLCRTSQSYILEKKCHHSNGKKLHKMQESAASVIGDKHHAGGRGESATQISPFTMCLMTRAC